MKINEIKKKDGSTVYRTNIYLGVDVITGKKVTTKVTARTKKELKTKAQQAHFDGSIISVVGKTTVEIIELFKCTQKVP